MATTRVGSVATFRDLRPDKAQALKPLEEAAEALAAWQAWDAARAARDKETADTTPQVSRAREIALEEARSALVDECCDAIQAAVNLCAAVGVTDLTVPMYRCECRSRERGRL